MLNRLEQINNLMWKEVVSKGSAATMGFNVFAILIYFFHFGNIPNAELIKGSCLLILLANTIRLWFSKKISHYDIIKIKEISVLRLTIALNAIGWSTIFSIVALEANDKPLVFGFMITIMTGFLTASIITLSYDRWSYFIFQIVILLPLNVIFIYLYAFKNIPMAIYFAFLFLFYFVYQIKQFHVYREQLTQRFNYQLDVINSYDDLKKNQKHFVDQTAKLIHASKIAALGEMSGGLAHEVNNSLMVIMGSMQQIERQIKTHQMMDSTLETKFNQATNSVMKIKSVIEGLKSFSLQMDSVPKEIVQLNEIIERTLVYTQELLHAHGVKLIIESIPNVSIKCSPFQIIQILFNLTKNADDALSKVTAHEKWIKLDFGVKNNYVFICVSNSGPVISEESREKLFLPFFTTKDVGQGTGLSLSISKGFALEHNGDIYLETNSANTTFTLKLPISVSL